MNDSHNHQPDEFGTLVTECWCKRTMLRVPARLVRQGETRSCGLEVCKP